MLLTPHVVVVAATVLCVVVVVVDDDDRFNIALFYALEQTQHSDVILHG